MNGEHGKTQRFSTDLVLQAAQQLYNLVPLGLAPSVKERRAADQYLCDFQRSDSAVPVSVSIISAAVHFEAGQGASAAVPSEALLLLASCVRRRLQRGHAPGAPAPEELMQLAVQLAACHRLAQAGEKAADLLVRGAVAQNLHQGSIPIKKLLAAAAAGAVPESRLALEAVPAASPTGPSGAGKCSPTSIGSSQQQLRGCTGCIATGCCN